MLAHRGQENLTQGRVVRSKQQQRTPGTRFTKTPLKVPLNDENAPTTLPGKSGVGGMVKAGGDQKMTTRGKGAREALGTPKGAAILLKNHSVWMVRGLKADEHIRRSRTNAFG